MKRYSFKIGVSLMALTLVGLTALAAVATTRPFHLVEHGTLTPNPDGSTTADGTGIATHIGDFKIHRTFTLTATNVENKMDLKGEAILTAPNGDTLNTGLEGPLVIDPIAKTGHADLIYQWEGGTGRFENATGMTLWHVDVNLADGTYEVVADGVIKY